MRSKKLLISLVLLLLTILLGAGYLQSNNLELLLERSQPGMYKVVEVNDGDTITVEVNDQHERVRLIGIDTPELHHPEKPVQCFAEAAKQYTASLINVNRVRLEADPEDDNRDLYGRLLRYVYLPDGTLVNAEIILSGHGFAYTHFPFTKKQEFRDYERTAREQGRGLWAGCTLQETEYGPETQPAS